MISERSAIIHDWFQGMHGAERTVDTIRRCLFAPPAPPDIFTFSAAHELLPADLSAAIVREARIAGLPGVRQRGHEPGRWRYLLPYMSHWFRSLDLDRYDVVLASSHACAVDVQPREDALFACYCYTPMRYAWLPDTDGQRARGLESLALAALRSRLRRTDAAAARRPHGYAAISTAVRERIRRFYGRDSVVVHPPVETGDFDPARDKESGRFLWVHRLVSYKRPELVIEAFRGLPYRLTMVGVGPLEGRVRRALPPNVELRGWMSRDELTELYSRSSAFVHMGDEDFGISMVEALAAGMPVVALDAGGARDIVRDRVDGVLVRDAGIETVRRAIREAANRPWDRGALAERASAFSADRFVERLEEWLDDLSREVRGRPL